MSEANALEALGLNVAEVVAVDEAVRDKSKTRGRDQRICICGHPLARHTEYSGVIACKPSKLDCPCRKARPVLRVDDTRWFLKKTFGGGSLHALTRGLATYLDAGRENAEWIVDLECDKCGESGSKVVPVPVTQNGIAVDHATGWDVFLCESCRESV